MHYGNDEKAVNLQLNPNKAQPKCPVFGKCGGCSSQHITHSAQLESKRKSVEFLMKGARPDWAGGALAVSGEPYEYRNRMDFVFSSFAKGLGLREKGSYHRVVGVKECPISNPLLNTLLNEVNSWFASCRDLVPFDVKRNSGTLRYAVIRTNRKQDDSSVSFVLNEEGSQLQKHISAIKEFATSTSAKNVVITYTPPKTDVSISEEYFEVKGKNSIGEEFLGRKLNYPVQGFFQNNPEMAERMMQHIRSILEKEQRQDVFLLDLYGGVGTFALAVADLYSEGLTLESYEESTEYAEKNLDANGFHHLKAECLDAASLKKLELDKKSSRLHIITDPPRSGMHPKTVQELVRLNPELIIYISCNPEQLVKELIHFKNHAIDSVTVFDLFPQTPHAEAIVVLRRK